MKSHVTFRMTALLIATSSLLLVVGLIAVWHVHSMDRSNSEILDLNITSLKAAQEFEIGVREIRTQWNNYRLTADRRYLESMPILRAETQKALVRAEELANTEDERVMTEKMREGFETLMRAVESSKLDDSTEDEVKTLAQNVLEPAHDYLNLNMQMAQMSSRENKQLANWTIGVLLGLGVGGAVAGLLAGVGIAQRFRRSIVKLDLTIQDAAGRLNEVMPPVTFASGSDITDVEAALAEVSERITSVVQQLQQSQREVLRSEQLAALGQLAAGLAHEFRNPLTAIKILVQSAAHQGEAGSLNGRDLAILEKEVARLEHSIQNFMDFARPPRLEKRVFEMREVLEQTLGLLAARARTQEVRFECTLPDEPALADADIGQIRQVVLNLLLNALDVLRQGGIIRVQLSLAPDALQLRVLDNGPGLPDDLGDRIFEPFVSTKETGLGLGLSICKRIVDAHGGSIRAEPRPEGGAAFEVQLRRAHLPKQTAA